MPQLTRSICLLSAEYNILYFIHNLDIEEKDHPKIKCLQIDSDRHHPLKMDDQHSDDSLLSGSESGEENQRRISSLNSSSSDDSLLDCSYEYSNYKELDTPLCVTYQEVSDLPIEENTSQYVGCDVSYDPASALENRSYTDSVSSADSTQPLLSKFVSNEIEQSGNSTENSKDDPFHLAISDWDIGESRVRADTMSKMFGSLAFIDAMIEPVPVESLLSRACQKGSTAWNKNRKASIGLLPKKEVIGHDLTGVQIEECALNSVGNHTRNLIVLSIGISLMYIPLGSLRNLQSSLNHKEGIGLYSLAAAYAAYMIGSLFTPFIVKQFQTKSCLVIGLIPQLLYIVTNAYPTLYFLIPVSALQGLGNALLWNAITTYTTFLAKGNATLKREKLEHTISKFFGIFFLVFQWSNVLGNLISSLVFMYGEADTPDDPSVHNTTAIMNNMTVINNNAYAINSSNIDSYRITTERDSIVENHFHLCGSNYCHSYTIDHAGMTVSEPTKLLLIGIYSGFAAIAIVLIGGFLEPLRLYRTTAMKCGEIGGQFVEVMKFMCQRKFLLISLLCIYSTLQNGFVTSEVTKAYITCPLGIYMVGYSMICFGLCGAAGSYLSGWLTKHTGRMATISAVPCIKSLMIPA
ncbi:hypothetical protein ScPMuIL_000374 [Solemya velum]